MTATTTERRRHWESIYSERSPLEVSWYQLRPEMSLRLIGNAGPDRSLSVIDIGGGASKLIDHLLEAGYRRPAVLDISDTALDHARTRLGPRADEAEWHCADITAFEPPRRYDLWHDRAVFHFLGEAEDRRAYRRVLERAVAPGGHLIIGAFAIGGPEMCSGLPIVQYDAERITAELGDRYELVEEAQENHHTPAGKDQLFAWFRFRRV